MLGIWLIAASIQADWGMLKQQAYADTFQAKTLGWNPQRDYIRTRQASGGHDSKQSG